MSKKMQDYDEFVAKFKPKHTTADCYTPPLVYDAVLKWARENLNVGDRPVVRPFYPGGDYERYPYPEGCVVIDNPPFSILSKICNYYVERGIPFLLFAPAMTSIRPGCCYIGTPCNITYENGANVNTAFVTNLLDDVCITAPELLNMVDEAVNITTKQQKKTLPKLIFPDCVLRASALHSMSRAGISFRVKRGEGCVVGHACEGKKGEFGNSILLSAKKTAERRAAEKLAAERRAAKKIAAEKLAAEKLAAERLAAEKMELNQKARMLLEVLDKGMGYDGCWVAPAPTIDQP